MPADIVSSVHPCSHESDFGSLRTAIQGINETLADIKQVLTKHAVLEEQNAQMRGQISHLFTRIHTLELEAANHHGSGKWIEKVVWVIISIGIASIVASKIPGLVP